MNDVATFFRDRRNDPGETYEVAFEGSAGTHRVSVYSQRPFESNALQDKTAAKAKDLELAVKDLRNAVAGSGGGGMIVISNDEGRTRTFNVMRVNAKGYSAAQRFIALSPGRPATVVNIDDASREYRCAANSYALVPVSAEAEQRLQDFVDHLAWLSPDVQAIVLHAIRRPSLDWRLDRVETRVFGQTADDDLAESQQGLLGRLKRWLERPAAAAVMLMMVVLLVLLSALGGAAWYVLHSKDHTNLLSGILHAGAGAKEETADPENAKAVVADARTLLQALHASKKAPVHTLDVTQFASLDVEKSDEQIQAAFAKGPSTLLGLVKLQLLALDPSQDTAYLGSPDIALAKAAYAAIPPAKLTDDARQFLAAVRCRMERDSPMPFDPDDCTKVPADAFQTGLRRLTTFVKGRS